MKNSSSSSFFDISDSNRLSIYDAIEKHPKKNPVYITPLSTNNNINSYIEKANKSPSLNQNEENTQKAEKESDDLSSMSEIIINSSILKNTPKSINDKNKSESKFTLNNDHFEQFKSESQFFEDYVFTQTQQSTSINNFSIMDRNNSINKFSFLNDNSQLCTNKDKKSNDDNSKIINKAITGNNEKRNTEEKVNNVSDNNTVNEKKTKSNTRNININNKANDIVEKETQKDDFNINYTKDDYSKVNEKEIESNICKEFLNSEKIEIIDISSESESSSKKENNVKLIENPINDNSNGKLDEKKKPNNYEINLEENSLCRHNKGKKEDTFIKSLDKIKMISQDYYNNVYNEIKHMIYSYPNKYNIQNKENIDEIINDFIKGISENIDKIVHTNRMNYSNKNHSAKTNEIIIIEDEKQDRENSDEDDSSTNDVYSIETISTKKLSINDVNNINYDNERINQISHINNDVYIRLLQRKIYNCNDNNNYKKLNINKHSYNPIFNNPYSYQYSSKAISDSSPVNDYSNIIIDANTIENEFNNQHYISNNNNIYSKQKYHKTLNTNIYYCNNNNNTVENIKSKLQKKKNDNESSKKNTLTFPVFNIYPQKLNYEMFENNKLNENVETLENFNYQYSSTTYIYDDTNEVISQSNDSQEDKQFVDEYEEDNFTDDNKNELTETGIDTKNENALTEINVDTKNKNALTEIDDDINDKSMLKEIDIDTKNKKNNILQKTNKIEILCSTENSNIIKSQENFDHPVSKFNKNYEKEDINIDNNFSCNEDKYNINNKKYNNNDGSNNNFTEIDNTKYNNNDSSNNDDDNFEQTLTKTIIDKENKNETSKNISKNAKKNEKIPNFYDNGIINLILPKRKRGRPRKYDVPTYNKKIKNIISKSPDHLNIEKNDTNNDNYSINDSNTTKIDNINDNNNNNIEKTLTKTIIDKENKIETSKNISENAKKIEKIPNSYDDDGNINLILPKRKRGRPRKYDVPTYNKKIKNIISKSPDHLNIEKNDTNNDNCSINDSNATNDNNDDDGNFEKALIKTIIGKESINEISNNNGNDNIIIPKRKRERSIKYNVPTYNKKIKNIISKSPNHLNIEKNSINISNIDNSNYDNNSHSNDMYYEHTLTINKENLNEIPDKDLECEKEFENEPNTKDNRILLKKKKGRPRKNLITIYTKKTKDHLSNISKYSESEKKDNNSITSSGKQGLGISTMESPKRNLNNKSNTEGMKKLNTNIQKYKKNISYKKIESNKEFIDMNTVDSISKLFKPLLNSLNSNNKDNNN
ncbi:hypothetical protein BCR36DRAFT_452307 [Piromyces finnis]|uniref:Uncharacterized protein n=1 Tax=Piromyces finnis TaxID=1754191 RepID=A0A1Y1V7K3_9FUNG|nr:hypothetical protein BCR36DRAFT_452307 [Piromyces finnis]|eukprot:ORX48386.1 hypothetical protein BCR36DRAFT_452307 [Piromyces finnis]